MDVALRAKVFRNADGQAVSIPPEYEFASGEVIVRREGLRLVLEPAVALPENQPRTLKELLASWDELDEDIGPIEDQPPEPVNL